MPDTHDDRPERLAARVDAALDDLLGPAPEEIVEEQPPAPPRPPHDSGAEDEHARTFPARYGG